MKADLPYLQAFRSRGRLFTYYRRNGRRIRIRGEATAAADGTISADAAWRAHYASIHDEFENPKAEPAEPAARTFAALIRQYKTSSEYRELAPKTRSGYDGHLEYFDRVWGAKQVPALSRSGVLAVREKFSATPAMANQRLRVLRLLLSFAVDHEYRGDNPASKPKRLKIGEWRPWEEHELAAYEARWPLGTLERMAYEIAIGTGQRGGDCVAMRRQHYDGHAISVTQEKTGARVWLPASARLKAALDPWLAAHPHVMILTTPAGRALSVHYWRHMMGAAIRAAGLPESCKTHGLRYTAATVLHEAGGDWDEIMTVTGHKTVEMARKYARQRRTARVAIRRINRIDAERKRNREDDRSV